MSSQQLTLGLEETDADRIRPSTFVYCDVCEEAVWKGEEHEHDLSGMAAYEKAQIQLLEEKIPEHARIVTQKWIVDFHYTAVERVVVEAANESDAREQADHIRSYDAEIEDLVHTDTPRGVGELSPVSVEYLENNGLLPEDHDVTQDEIDQLAGGDSS